MINGKGTICVKKLMGNSLFLYNFKECITFIQKAKAVK